MPKVEQWMMRLSIFIFIYLVAISVIFRLMDNRCPCSPNNMLAYLRLHIICRELLNEKRSDEDQ